MDSMNEIVKGRKTFFIAPDELLLSQDFLEEYLAKDYECYFIKSDLNNSIVTKVKTILSLFSDCIIFFNIDYHIENEGTDWPHFINTISKDYPNACIGIMYERRKSIAEKNLIEQLYLLKLGIKGGCVQLEFQKYRNFVLIEKVLYANQAMGRRKTVRAICSNNNCYINLEDKKGKTVYLPINDISLSHFSITIDDNNEELDFSNKLMRLSFIVKGMRFISNAILFTQRKLESSTIYVFAFFNDLGKVGLDTNLNKLLIQKMYEILYENCSNLLFSSYDSNNESKKLEAPVIVKKDIIFDESLVEQTIN